MDLSTAISLIRGGVPESITSPQIWADFGAGEGLFSKALATLLPENSRIYAVDRDASALNGITWSYPTQTLVRMVSDVALPVPLPVLDGMMLGNLLHFLPDQSGFIRQLSGMLSADGVIMVVEYDTETSSRWIPYPVSLKKLEALAGNEQFDASFLARERSKFNSASLYSAVLRREPI